MIQRGKTRLKTTAPIATPVPICLRTTNTIVRTIAAAIPRNDVPDLLGDPGPGPPLVHQRTWRVRGGDVLEPVGLSQQRQRRDDGRRPGKWTTALGTGALLSKASFDLQTGDQNVGLGPLTADRYYGMGVVYTNGRIFTNPQFDGYTGVLGYLPAKKPTVAVASTFAPKGDITVS